MPAAARGTRVEPQRWREDGRKDRRWPRRWQKRRRQKHVGVPEGRRPARDTVCTTRC